MKILAVDPSLHSLGLCIFINGNIFAVGVLKVDSSIKGINACFKMASKFLEFLSNNPSINKIVIEGQEVYKGFQGEKRKTPNIESIRLLSFLSGMVSAIGATVSVGFEGVLEVKPAEWKGQIPKHPHHRQIANRLGLQWKESNTKKPYIIVTSPIPQLRDTSHISDIDWWNILDAIGIAEWASKKLKYETP